MQDLTILALDLATTTGWACSDGTSGADDFAAPANGVKHALSETARHGLIASRFDGWLHAKLTLTQAGVLLVEKPMVSAKRPGALRGSAVTLGLRMLALKVGWERRLLVLEVWEAQWKPWAKRCGWWQKGDEADARAMLGWFAEQRLPMLVGDTTQVKKSDHPREQGVMT